MRLVAYKREVTIQSDPKPMDRATWQRIRVAAELEAIHRDWGVVLYSLHRCGQISNDAREGGDRYTTLITDYRKLWRDHMGDIEVYRDNKYECLEKRSPLTADVEGMIGTVINDSQESEFEIRRAKRIGARYKEARAIVGPINSTVEAMLIDEIWPAWWLHEAIDNALIRVLHFLCMGTNRKRQKRV